MLLNITHISLDSNGGGFINVHIQPTHVKESFFNHLTHFPFTFVHSYSEGNRFEFGYGIASQDEKYSDFDKYSDLYSDFEKYSDLYSDLKNIRISKNIRILKNIRI